MYPAFVNCTTIDWFHEWPQDALLEVAERSLSDMEFGTEEDVSHLSFHLADVGGGVGGLADMEFGTEDDVSHLSFQF